MRGVNLFLHADGLTEEAVDIFEIHAAVRHALHGTVKTSRSMKALAVVTVEFCKYGVLCAISPACILYSVDGSLTLLLPALHISLHEKEQKTHPLDMQDKGYNYIVLVDVLFVFNCNQKIITVTKPNKRKYRLMQN